MSMSNMQNCLWLMCFLGAATATALKLKDAADYEVKRDFLEERYPAFKSFHGTMHAGMMPAGIIDNETGDDEFSSYFFWLLRPDVDANDQSASQFRNDTLLIWLNGGPGCSSMVGMMGEMGPVGTPKFRPGIPSPNPAPLVENDYAWTKKTAMLFVEQPGGVGFSTASKKWTGKKATKRTEEDVASSFYAFLQNFYAVFGDDLIEKKLYLSGESYAGMYIPSIAHMIHIQNQNLLIDTSHSGSSLKHINLGGAAIGNGWIDPKIQGPTTIDYAWWHGMIDLQSYRGLHAKWDECVINQILDSSEKPFHPFTTPDECGISVAVMKASGSAFMYDVTTYDTYPDILDEGGIVSSFFNDPAVRESLNAPSINEHEVWLQCVPGAGRRRRLDSKHNRRELLLLDKDRPYSVVPYIAALLDDANIDILLYNGDLDLACSSQSTELAIESMHWSGATAWMDPNTTKWKQWMIDGQPAGHVKSYNKLQFVVVYNSGHFVPINQAENALDMISRWLDGQSFGDKDLPMFPTFPESTNTLGPPVDEESPPVDEDLSKTQRHSYSLITGLIGFLLGLLTPRIFFRRSASRLSPSTSSLQLVSEETPLRHE